MTFLLLIAFWFCLNILEQQDWRGYLLAGLATGIAIVTKYPAAVFTLTIALAHFSATPTSRPLAHRKLLGSAAACLAGVFAGSPFIFLDFRTVLKDVIREARPEHLSATGDGFVAKPSVVRSGTAYFFTLNGGSGFGGCWYRILSYFQTEEPMGIDKFSDTFLAVHLLTKPPLGALDRACSSFSGTASSAWRLQNSRNSYQSVLALDWFWQPR